MTCKRTKKLTIDRALKILQLKYGTQVRKVEKYKNTFIANSILLEKREFTREQILSIEDEIYSSFGV